MRGLKFLFKSCTKWMWVVLLTAVIFAGIAVISCIFKNGQGEEDYLMSSAFLQLTSNCVLTLASITGFMNINGNKLIRSSPIAKELYTKSVPLFIIILSLGSAVVANGIYFITLAGQGAPASCFSDALVFMTINSGLNILTFSLISRMMSGGILGIDLSLIPYVSAILAMGDNIKRSGFGLPIWVSALMLTGVITVSSVFSFIISGILFKKLNFSQPAAPYITK